MNLFKIYECAGNCELFGFSISNSSVCQLIPSLLLITILTILVLGLKHLYSNYCTTPM